ncbi:MAG: hypothetical protein M3R57_07705 [Chloroflexota bacterium]|nr:hypothetical protein [Chloroflexota bacterium]
MIALILVGLGLYALAYAAWSVVIAGPYFQLVLVLMTIPYGTIGLLGLVAGLLWRRGYKLGGPIAFLWVLVTGAGVTFAFIDQWLPRLEALGDPNVTYNWALPDVWVPVPLALGLVVVVLAGVVRLARRSGPKAAPTG